MLGVQVKVFWPAMCRWYAGRVGSFDAAAGQHTILYKDGDVQRLTLEHEAVQWLDLPPVDTASVAAGRFAAGWGHSAEQVWFWSECVATCTLWTSLDRSYTGIYHAARVSFFNRGAFSSKWLVMRRRWQERRPRGASARRKGTAPGLLQHTGTGPTASRAAPARVGPLALLTLPAHAPGQQLLLCW